MADVRPEPSAVGLEDRLPVEVRARQPRPLGSSQRLRAHGVEAEAGRQHQALLRAADGDVDAPLVVPVVDRPERGDRVDQEQGVGPRGVDRLAHLGDAAGDARSRSRCAPPSRRRSRDRCAARPPPCRGRRRGASRPRPSRPRARAARPSPATASRSGRSRRPAPGRPATACSPAPPPRRRCPTTGRSPPGRRCGTPPPSRRAPRGRARRTRARGGRWSARRSRAAPGPARWSGRGSAGNAVPRSTGVPATASW